MQQQTETQDNPQDERHTAAPVEIAADAAETEVFEPRVTADMLALLEAALLVVNAPLSMERMLTLFPASQVPTRKLLREALEQLQMDYSGRVSEVVEVASGWRIQVREHFGARLASLWEEKPPRFSRALLETLALIVYRQPITRGEIEEIRSVSLSPNIVRTLMEREWVRSLGVREVPGRPELLGTTKQFLDDFGIKALDELPSLPEIRDLDALAGALQALTGEEQPELLEASAREAQANSQSETSLADAAAQARARAATSLAELALEEGDSDTDGQDADDALAAQDAEPTDAAFSDDADPVTDETSATASDESLDLATDELPGDQTPGELAVRDASTADTETGPETGPETDPTADTPATTAHERDHAQTDPQPR